MKRLLRDALEESTITQSIVSGFHTPQALWSADRALRLTPMLLRHTDAEELHVTGVAVVAHASEKSLEAPVRLLEALSRSLGRAGDALGPPDQP